MIMTSLLKEVVCAWKKPSTSVMHTEPVSVTNVVSMQKTQDGQRLLRRLKRLSQMGKYSKAVYTCAT